MLSDVTKIVSLPVAAFPLLDISHLTVALAPRCHCNLSKKLESSLCLQVLLPVRHSMLSHFFCRTSQTYDNDITLVFSMFFLPLLVHGDSALLSKHGPNIKKRVSWSLKCLADIILVKLCNVFTLIWTFWWPQKVAPWQCDWRKDQSAFGRGRSWTSP